jgi:hypothetical protein
MFRAEPSGSLQADTVVMAPGFSAHLQIKHLPLQIALHPAKLLTIKED